MKKIPKFKNESNYEFKSLEHEKYRVYTFPNNQKIRIDSPLYFSVSENGHRVFDIFQVSHYIPKGWIHLYWEVYDEKPNFKY